MFINEKILIGLMKKAYQATGLYMGCYDGWYHLSGVLWQARILKEEITKPILSAMVACAGELPREGEGWVADKEKNQYSAFSQWEEPQGDQLMERTPVIVQAVGGSPLRVMQLPNDGVMLFYEKLVSAIDHMSVNRERGEGHISGPYYDGRRGMWASTNHAVFKCCSGQWKRLDGICAILGSGPLHFDEDD